MRQHAERELAQARSGARQDAAHFANLVHSESDAGDMGVDLDFARVRNVGMIYVTDDVLPPNPWDSLATYWLSELDSLRRLP